MLDPDIPKSYFHSHNTITIIDYAGCEISIDYLRTRGRISLTNRRMVEYVREVLLGCAHLGHGGWVHMQESWEWIVIVEGSRSVGRVG